jgi:diguanylate cyclase (GGDEF)-like protein/putative nucleotidyltransferase with HDIG domain
MPPNQWLVLRAPYLALVYLVGAAVVAKMTVDSVEPGWVPFIILLVMAFTTNPLKVGLPRVDRTVSLSFLFTFAAMTELPAASAFYIAAVAEAHSLIAERPERLSWPNISFRFAALAICVFSTSLCYQQFAGQLEGPARAAAAGINYYAVSSLLRTFLISIEEGQAPWRVWNERFFWSGPVYLLAAVGLSLVQRLTTALSTEESLLALTLIFVPYFYLRRYWSRLTDYEDHVREVAAIRHRAIETLAAAIESKDGASAGHLRRVRRSAVQLAEVVGCSEADREVIEQAALLHDIGKVGVPDYILMKPGPLTEHEFSQIAAHSNIGAAIVDSARFPGPVGEIIRCHHEHWDGSGYPGGLKEEQIPRLARVLTIVDCFDALTSDRPYRPAMSFGEAIGVLKKKRGEIFDPGILDAFLKLAPGLMASRDPAEDSEPEQRISLSAQAVPIQQTWMEDGAENTRALRHKGLEGLSRTPDHLWAIYEILDMLGADLEFEKSLKACLHILCRPIPYDKAGIFVLEGGRFVLFAAEGFPQHCVSRLSLSPDHGLVAQSAISRSAITANAPPSELPSEGAPRYLADVKSSLVAPLVVDERVVGMITLCGKQEDAFTDEQGHSLSLIAPKLARTLLSSRTVQKISAEAETDTVTGLPNARAAFRRLEAEMKRAERNGSSVGILFMDVDGLKPVNDNYGHRAGDELLIEVAARLKGRLRAYDIAARLGGDEFIAILPGLSREDLFSMAESMRQCVSKEPIKVADDRFTSASISVGSAMYPSDALDIDDLVNLSDQRMYQAKVKVRPSRSTKDVSTAAG